MKIVAVNGSPKMKDSLSERIIAEMEQLLTAKISVHHAGNLVKAATPPDVINEMLDADALLIVFPLYCDALPASLVELLTRLEAAARGSERKPRLFAVVNCGFYESSQNATALAICRHFADRAGFPWGYGLGVGGGPALSGFKSWTRWPASGVRAALRDMAGAILAGKSGADVFRSVGIPRFACLLAIKLIMRCQMWKNSTKNPRARPYAVQ